jgi:hypothetical protein
MNAFFQLLTAVDRASFSGWLTPGQLRRDLPVAAAFPQPGGLEQPSYRMCAGRD